MLVASWNSQIKYKSFIYDIETLGWKKFSALSLFIEEKREREKEEIRERGKKRKREREKEEKREREKERKREKEKERKREREKERKREREKERKRERPLQETLSLSLLVNYWISVQEE